jgi:hypothetical protein
VAGNGCPLVLADSQLNERGPDDLCAGTWYLTDFILKNTGMPDGWGRAVSII